MSVISVYLIVLFLKGSSHVSTSSNPRETVVTALEQANAISNIANSLLQPHIDEENILKAQVSFYMCVSTYTHTHTDTHTHAQGCVCVCVCVVCVCVCII